MTQSSYLRDQTERCRRLAHDSTDPTLRDNLLRLADEYAARAAAPDVGGIAVWRAGSDNDDGAV
jgi:hypothetical protein